MPYPKTDRPVCKVILGCEDGFPRCKTDKIAINTAIPGTGFGLERIVTHIAGDIAPRVDPEFYFLSAEKLAVWQELSSIRERVVLGCPRCDATEYLRSQYVGDGAMRQIPRLAPSGAHHW